ncbi:putative NADPH2 dehydrogenase chain OYE2 [Atractiella rhizophila]|nr:putative NADPH2 dehydrogenase chain OYE2 [Atractiella rhizophila]
MSNINSEALFTATQVGDLNVQHRIAPLTRFRANEEHVHGELGALYYNQRSGYPGTLLITEATLIAREAGGEGTVPGIWTKDQISGWKTITDAVHANKSFIYCQLWNLGRQAKVQITQKEGIDFVSAGDIPIVTGETKPRPLTKDEIKQHIGFYKQAALNAMEAGFDGVEIHAANGYLLDQFLQEVSNNRTDEYGGSIENRARIVKEVLAAVVSVVGVEKTAIRFSPYSSFGGMADSSKETAHLISFLKENYSDLSYIHLITPRIDGNIEKAVGPSAKANDTFMELRKSWAPRALVLAGGFSPTEALKEVEQAEGENLLIAFGRYFISNPDLPRRVKNNYNLTKYTRDTFYTSGREGYVDYQVVDI